MVPALDLNPGAQGREICRASPTETVFDGFELIRSLIKRFGIYLMNGYLRRILTELRLRA